MFGLRGVHPRSSKHTSEAELKTLNEVTTVRIPMAMQIGPGCKICVKKGDEVKVGQLVGEPIAPMSVPIYASVSGVVTNVKPQVKSDGTMMEMVEIQSDGQFTVAEDIVAPNVTTKEELVEAVRKAGLVGLGGAGFPTHFKLNPPPDKQIDHLLINGMECEPYITSDEYIARNFIEEILQGIEVVMRLCQIPKCIIGMENNKPKAIKGLVARVKEAQQGVLKDKDVTVQGVHTCYPQGAEKVMIRTLAKREVPSGKLPHDVGCLVMNIGTIRYIAHYLNTGMPLTRKIITLDGSAVAKPGNYDVPIGAKISEIVELSGGFKDEAHKVIMGGPMMGVAVDDLDSPIIKNNNAILVFDEDDATIPQESACIRCGRCVRACPMYLMPTELDQAARKRKLASLTEHAVMDCIECGCCTFVCPAKRYLVQNIRVGKGLLRAHQARLRAEQEKQKQAVKGGVA